MNLTKIMRYTSQNNRNNKKLDPQQEANTNQQSTSKTKTTTDPITKAGINQRNVTNNHVQQIDANNFNSNNIKHKIQKKNEQEDQINNKLQKY